MDANNRDPSAFRWPERANELTVLSDKLYPSEVDEIELVTDAKTAIAESEASPGAVGRFLLAPALEGMPDLNLVLVDQYMRRGFLYTEAIGTNSGALDVRCVVDAHAVNKEAFVQRYTAWLTAAHSEMGSVAVYRLEADELFSLSTTVESTLSSFGQQLQEDSGYLVGGSLIRDHDRVDKFLQRVDTMDRELGAPEGTRGVIVDFTSLPGGQDGREELLNILRFETVLGWRKDVKRRKEFSPDFALLNEPFEGDRDESNTNARAAEIAFNALIARIKDENHSMDDILAAIDEQFKEPKTQLYARYVLLQQQISWLNRVRNIPKGWHVHVLADHELIAYLYSQRSGFDLIQEAGISGGNFPDTPMGSLDMEGNNVHPVHTAIAELSQRQWDDDPFMRAKETALMETYAKQLL